MKNISFLSILFFTVLCAAGQQVQFASDVLKLIKKIDDDSALKIHNISFNHCDSHCLQEPVQLFSYFVNSIDGQVQKVLAIEISTKRLRTYYFNNERLVGVKECGDAPNSISSISFFTDGLLSIGTTYKDNSDDESLLRRKSLLADAYLILLHSKSLANKVQLNMK